MKYFTRLISIVLVIFSFSPYTYAQTQGEIYDFIRQGKYQEGFKSLISHPNPDPVIQQSLLGALFYHLGEYDSARASLAQAISLSTQSPGTYRKELGHSHHYAAKLAFAERKHSEGHHHVDKALNFRPEPYAAERIETLTVKGALFFSEGKYEAAAGFLEDILADSAQFPAYLKGEIYYTLGRINIFQRNNVAALKHLLSAEKTTLETLGKGHPSLIYIYSNLGYIHYSSRQILKAKEYIEQALDISHASWGPDHPALGTIYYYAGSIYDRAQEYGRSKEFFLEAIRLNKLHQGQRNSRLATFYMSLGSVYRNTDEVDKALDSYKLSLQIIEEVDPNYQFKDYLYNNIAYGYNAKKEYQQALAYLDLAWAFGRKKFDEYHPSFLNIYETYGNIYYAQGQYDKALSYLKKNEKIALAQDGMQQALRARVQFKIARTYRKKKDPIHSLDAITKALDILNLRSILTEQDPPINFSELTDPVLVADICIETAKILNLKANVDGGGKSFKQKAFNILIFSEKFIDFIRNTYLSETAKLDFASRVKHFYEVSIEIAFELHAATGDLTFLERAFRNSEKSKAFLLLLSLQDNQALVNSGISVELLEKERELEEKLERAKTEISLLDAQNTAGNNEKAEALQRTIFALTTQKDSLNQALEKQYPAYYQAKYQVEIPNLADVRKLLPSQKTAMISYFWGSDHLYTFYISSEDFFGWQIKPPDSLSKKIGRFRELIYSPFQAKTAEEIYQTRQEFISLGDHFFQVLLHPILKVQQAPINRWKIIPDGALGHLNFELLPTSLSDSETSYKSLPYLIKSHDISYEYSAALWKYIAEMSPAAPQSEKVLALRPTYPETQLSPSADVQRRSGFGPLFYSKEEVEGIQKSFSTKLLEGRKASEYNFNAYAGKYKFIHISSHAQVPPGREEDAFIAFTNTENAQYDDSLRLGELQLQKLQAEMVVLSACETGTGKLYEGEGIMSLGRGFTYAGARSLVMSLWEVNDASTADIMSLFYTNLALGHTKDAALRKAKLDYLVSSDALQSHPYYWAAFVPMGDMSPVSQQRSWPYLWWGLVAFIAFGAFAIARKRFS